MAVDPNDGRIRAFMMRSRAPTWSAMAAEIEAEFGAARAWPVELVAHVYRQLPLSRKRTAYERDAELIGFIRDRADLVSIDALKRAVDAAFGAIRAPSHSQLHRIVVKERLRAAREAARAVTAR
jgi:hypothetical protein